ncbi:hypothetical protein BpHYR1_035316 [Brachionus plicatilis]|uniref:Uncharacterized protein n=1 Tax=Brachionus plicatilis TaxID=10195 RepID=A0A3M7P371_BRAPC|nr:hypothetical protein BpHYR1_035316 [Brachionus plicatilis]
MILSEFFFENTRVMIEIKKRHYGKYCQDLLIIMNLFKILLFWSKNLDNYKKNRVEKYFCVLFILNFSKLATMFFNNLRQVVKKLFFVKKNDELTGLTR